MGKSIVPVNRPTKLPAPTLSDLYEWLPELFILGLFLFGSMVTSGAVSLICLLLAAAPAVWIVACRARTARRNAAVLAEYDTDLIAADARALAPERGRDQ